MSKVIIIIVIIDTFPTYCVWNISWLCILQVDTDVTVMMRKVIIIIVIIDTFPTYYVWNISWLCILQVDTDVTVLMSKVIIIVIKATHPTWYVSNIS